MECLKLCLLRYAKNFSFFKRTFGWPWPPPVVRVLKEMTSVRNGVEEISRLFLSFHAIQFYMGYCREAVAELNTPWEVSLGSPLGNP